MKKARRNRKEKLNSRIDIRLNSADKNRITWLATQYAGGNVSLWIIYAAKNVERKYLIKKTDS